MKNFKEGFAKIIFICAACISILAVALICVFLFANGVPGMAKIGVWDFLSGTKWKPGNDIYGILPMILGSVYVTAGALIIGVPAGLMTALFLSRFAGRRTARPEFCRLSPALMKASSAQQAIMLEPPQETKGKVTPVRGSRSTEPSTFRIV